MKKTVVFLGTPAFAVPSLEALIRTFDVIGVVTQPDRERDRKGKLIKGAVKACANANGIPVHSFEKISRDGVDTLKLLSPDIMITCAYGQLLSQEVLDIPRWGVLNVHASLLPKYRGSAPMQRALIAGETVTGITIMKTDIGMDSGPILCTSPMRIPNDMYIDGLYEQMSQAGAVILIRALHQYFDKEVELTEQDITKVTYAPMLKRVDFCIDFMRPAHAVRNQIRGAGFGACLSKTGAIKVYRADVCEGQGIPGEILLAKKRLVVACGEGALSLTELQAEGKKRLNAIDFLNGCGLKEGDMLENGA